MPYSFSVFCFSRGQRGTFGTSTDIGTSLIAFPFFCGCRRYLRPGRAEETQDMSQVTSERMSDKMLEGI